ncbi:hypothetical protein B0A52_03035 [Exophiala mesophila]|uniref:Uncharacterized protein n=1 Tax=Exophiala mesophila TaxID=212818 RepID=A0A438NCJ7_EXOME|nr:hypothetical protein B0A52_03035 [Exophiala mesophila]
MLFHHYVHRVAWLMIPIDGVRNPWKSTYPAIALQNSSAATRSLYHAILAQAAFNLSNLHASDPDYSRESHEHGLRHYGIALRELRESLEMPAQNYNASVGAVITLAVIEGVYVAKKQRWRRHFDGASGIITQFMHDKPWTECSDAWVISQSLALSFEVGKTGSKTADGYSPLTGDLLGAVSGQEFFGYTIGAYSKVINSISAIRLLGEELSRGQISENLDTRAARVLKDLSDVTDDTAHIEVEEVDDDPNSPYCQTNRRSEQERREDRLYNLHFKIFRNAGLIYLYRTIFDAAPYVIGDFISAVLSDAMEFLDLQGGSISIWPVFIAAVEACKEEDRAMVQRWIEFSCKLGIQNRLVARKIIQHVWEARDAEALSHGRDPSEVVIDWRDVQEQLGFDILLL